MEDDPDDEALTLRVLRANRILNAVVVARDGAEALECLLGKERTRGGAVLDDLAVVLLDLKLPKVDGLDVLRRLRLDERTRRLPVVILTSSREEKDLARAYGFGANGYVQKPLEFTQFAETIKGLGIYWLVINVPPPKGR